MKERQTNHRIFSELLAILEDRKVVHAETGGEVPEWNEEQRAALREAGWSDQDIADEIADRAARLAEHPKWTVCKDMPAALYDKLTEFDPATRKRVFKDEQDEAILFDSRIVFIPNLILNACICEALLRQFTRAELLACPGFIDRMGCILLDVDEELARRGFMMPVIDGGLIRNLLVYRYPDDRRPFILKSRKLEIALYA
jgi:hypothetical protein